MAMPRTSLIAARWLKPASARSARYTVPMPPWPSFRGCATPPMRPLAAIGAGPITPRIAVSLVGEKQRRRLEAIAGVRPWRRRATRLR